jgi:hypothetical protein
MTIIIATRDLIVTDSIVFMSGIPMIAEKLHVWDEESIFCSAGDSARAMCLMQYLIEDDSDNKLLLDKCNNEVGIYTTDNDPYFFSNLGKYRLLDSMILGSLKTPMSREIRSNSIVLEHTLSDIQAVLDCLIVVMRSEHPTLMLNGAMFAMSARRDNAWRIVKHYMP